MLFGVDIPEGPPTPHPPLPVPAPDKKGYHSATLRILHPSAYHQDLKLKFCRVMGQKLRYGRPCTHDLPGTHTWLAQHHIALIHSEFHLLTHAGIILEVWSKMLLHRLDSPHSLHLSACASDIWTCPQPPPYTQFAQKGCQPTELELRIPMIHLKFRESGPENKLETPC